MSSAAGAARGEAGRSREWRGLAVSIPGRGCGGVGGSGAGGGPGPLEAFARSVGTEGAAWTEPWGERREGTAAGRSRRRCAQRGSPAWRFLGAERAERRARGSPGAARPRGLEASRMAAAAAAVRVPRPSPPPPPRAQPASSPERTSSSTACPPCSRAPGWGRAEAPAA